MRSVRQWLSGLLCLALLLGLLPTAALAAESAQPTGEEVLHTLSDRTPVIKGDTSTKVTRAQLAELIYANTMLKRNIDLAGYGNADPAFSDITVTDTETNPEGGCTQTQREAIIALYKAGYISGTSTTEFSPKGKVSRGDGMLVIWMADGSRSNKEPMENPFSDEAIKPHHLPVATCFYATGMISGQAGEEGKDPTFGGDEEMSLFEAYMFIQRFDEKNEQYKKFLNNTDLGAVTRAEMVVEFYNRFSPELSDCATKESGTALYQAFIDLVSCTAEQKAAIQFFTERGIVNGTTNTTFTPNGPVSNLQLAMLLQRCAGWPETDTSSAQTSRAAVSTLSEEDNTLDTVFQFLVDNGADETSVQAANDNQNAPALLDDLTDWSESLRPKAPVISTEDGNTVTAGQSLSVTITCETQDAVIYYTTDGSDPATSETRQTYSSAISITKPTTLKAVAVKNNLVSEMDQAQYAYPALTITPSRTSLSGGGTVTLTVGCPATTAAPAVTVTCSDSGYTPTRGADGTWTVTLPNSTASYTFTASAEGYASASCTVSVTRYTSGGSSSSSSSGSNSSRPSTTTETVTNPDGSTTTTVTNNRTDTVTETTEYPDGSTTTVVTDGRTDTVTETTQYPDGSALVVETREDGTVTTTADDGGGNRTEVVENPDGSSQTTLERADGTTASIVTDRAGQTEIGVALSSRAVDEAREAGEAAALPIPAVSAPADWGEAPTVTMDLPRDFRALVEIPVEDVTPGTVAVLMEADGTETVIKTCLATENGLAVTLSDGDTVKIVDNSKSFDDVPDSHWAADAVAFAASRELFSGTGGGAFSPALPMNRGMLVTVLYRLEDMPAISGGSSFADVEDGMYYSDAVRWADGSGIVTGDGSGAFAPDRDITREELAVILHRYAQHKGYGASERTDLSAYADAGAISPYAVQAMTWANAEGLITGDGNGALNPGGSASRSEVAAILQRFIAAVAN